MLEADKDVNNSLIEYVANSGISVECDNAQLIILGLNSHSFSPR